MATVTPAFVVRPVREEEWATLGELTVEAYAATGLHDSPEWYVQELGDVGQRATTSCVLVAVAEGARVLGGVTYVAGPEDPYAEELVPGDAGIRMLAVDVRQQGRGVGRSLVEACIERASADGRSRIVLHTGTWMLAAQRLYARLGFRREPELDFLPLPGVQLLAYVLQLSESTRGVRTSLLPRSPATS